MADTKIFDLTALATVASGDVLPVVDVSDTTDSADGTTKKITRANLIAGLAGSGANNDITSLAGLTTPLSVPQGGSGAATLTGILKGNGTSAFTAVTAPSGTIVGTTDTQTLSGKTIDAVILTTSVTGSYLTASEILITDGSKNIVSASVATYPSLTELTYVKGVTSAIQTQIDAKLANVVEDTTPQLGGALDGQGNDLNNMGVLFLTEQAAAEADVAGKGQIWVLTATPNQLYFTDDAGTDHAVAMFDSLASTSNALGASLIGIEDSGGLITATTVEGALAENRTAIDALEAAGYITASSSNSLINKTIDGDNNSISNLDIGNEVDWAAAGDVSDAASFASGDKLLIFKAATGLRKIDYDDLPGVGGGISNVVEDTTPQLGGQLDVNGNAIGDGTLELLTFTETASAVNNLNVTNNATGNAPILSAVGDDTNIDLELAAKGSGNVVVTVGSLDLPASEALSFNGTAILSDSAGTMTLSDIDALDATTEATIEAAIDTLPNLTSIQGNTFTLTGDFIRSGAHSLTLTTTGATNVTLPTTGTLATLAGTESLSNKTLVTPDIGTPSAGVLTNCTGLPVSSGISGLGANVATFLATPSSANLAAAVTGETGSGALVFATSPTLVTPVLGVATATSINKMAITAPATSSTLAVADGKTFTASNTITLSATDGVSMNVTNNKLRTITFVINGGGSAITTGIKGDLEIPFACTITGVTLLADQTGSIVVDIWKDTYANYPADNADSITSAAPPTISSATKSQDTTLTGWTTSIAAGDILRFNVDSASSITRLTLSLTVITT